MPRARKRFRLEQHEEQPEAEEGSSDSSTGESSSDSSTYICIFMVLLIYLFLSINVVFKIVYIYINDNIFPLVELSEAAIIRYVRAGLQHRELQNSIAAIHFATMKQLRDAAESYFVN